MNDKLSELIKTVFDNLESLDEIDFKKNLLSYQSDPLTEILLNSNKLIQDDLEYPFIPLFKACDWEKYLEPVTMVLDYQPIVFDTRVQSSFEFVEYANTLYNETYCSIEGTIPITASWILGESQEKTDANELDINDKDYSWAMAA